MSSDSIREIFEKTAPNKIIKFGGCKLKTPYDGMVTQYDHAHHMSSSSANHKTDSEIVSSIIYLLEDFCKMYPTRKQRLKAVIKKNAKDIAIVGLTSLLFLQPRIDPLFEEELSIATILGCGIIVICYGLSIVQNLKQRRPSKESN